MPAAPPELVPQADAACLLEIVEVTKDFPGVRALDGVSLRVRRGSVHALMGENGAGKSTLMNIVAGLFPPSAGEIRLNGRPCRFAGPRDALEAGIAMIHQELNLVPAMTIAENIWIGREPLSRAGFVDHRELNRRTERLLARLNLALDPEEQVGDLTIANQQMVEIAKAVSTESGILIMDEPTSAITEREVDHLFRIIGQLRDDGKAIVYITHKMNEVFRIADDLSVFRDGRLVRSGPAGDFDQASLISAMVGRQLTQLFPKSRAGFGEVVLSVRQLALDGVFRDVSFDLREGEILGFAGLIGARRTAVAEAIYGITPPSSGEIRLYGKPAVIGSPASAIAQGLGLLTEDRKKSGLFLMLSVLENMQIASVRNFTRQGFVRQRDLAALCRRMGADLRVKTPDYDQIVQALSGGNQQKVLIARWLMTGPRILILDEPTRGIDVGARAEIYGLISKLAAKGVAILMISSELPEILGMSDRVLVMHEGRVTGILERAEATQEKIMRLATA